MLQHCISGNIDKAYKVYRMCSTVESSPRDVTLPSDGITYISIDFGEVSVGSGGAVLYFIAFGFYPSVVIL